MKRTLLFLAGMYCLVLQAMAQPVRLNNNDNLAIGIPLNPTQAIFIQMQDNENLDVRDSLWVTDGTPANTKRIGAAVSFDEESGFLVWNGRFFFGGITAAGGAELWVTDGTAAGTYMVADINPGMASSTPKAFIAYNNALYFFADNGTLGFELWKTDGTPGGTSMVKDINTGFGNSYNAESVYTIFKGEIYFTAKSNDGIELWKSAGTSATTVMVKDINPGEGSANPDILMLTEDFLFFSANNATNGYELWKTDGSTAGTQMVKDIFPGTSSAKISSMVKLNGKLLFAAEAAPDDQEIYITDGTAAGTFMVKDLQAGGGSAPDLANGIIFQEKLIFAAYTTATGRELYITDGTAAGTGLFKDVIPGPTGSYPNIWLDYSSWGTADNHDPQRTLYNGKIFFSIDINFKNQLWITDGTADNTVMVKDFGFYGLVFTSHFYTQSGLYFAGNDINTGIEIFKSQGTGNTTSLYADVNFGSESSIPFFQFFILNGKVFFTADDGDTESQLRDLYVLGSTEAPLPLQLLHFGAALQSSAVALQWTTHHETNTSHFEVERSTDGAGFSWIGRVQAAGNSNTSGYQHLDMEAPGLKSSKLYYRLKMVDTDGKFTYSPVVLIQLSQPVSSFAVAPNPVVDVLRLQFAAEKTQQATLRITNAGGQLVKQISLQVASGKNQQLVPLEQLPPGLYTATLVLDGQAPETKRFLKQ